MTAEAAARIRYSDATSALNDAFMNHLPDRHRRTILDAAAKIRAGWRSVAGIDASVQEQLRHIPESSIQGSSAYVEYVDAREAFREAMKAA